MKSPSISPRCRFILTLLAGAGVLPGLVPALWYAGAQVDDARAREAIWAAWPHGESVSRERHRARSVLVVAQVAVAGLGAGSAKARG